MNQKRMVMRMLPISLGVGALVGLIVAGLVSVQKPTYDAITTWTIAKKGIADQTKTPYYLYDQYYVALAAEQYADTVTGWFSSPGIIEELYAKANVALPTHKASKVSKLIKPTKRPPSNVAVQFEASNPDDALRLAEAAYSDLTARLESVSNSANPNETYTIVASKPFAAANKLNPVTYGIGAFVATSLAVLTLWGTILYIVAE